MLAGKRLELLKETVPKLSRVAVLWDPQNPGSAQQWKESQLPARELGLQLHSMEVSSADKFEGAFKEATKAGSAALAVMASPFFDSNQKRIADLATKNRLPAIYPRGDFVAGGGLMSYGADQVEPYRRAASMVDKILKGTKPADLPVEQPTKFELVINLKTAKQIGLTIPPNVLVRADEGDQISMSCQLENCSMKERKRVKRKIFTLLCWLLIFFSWPVPAEAQQPKKVPRIGYLSSSTQLLIPPVRGNSAGSARAWLHRRTEHRHRVPICGGEAIGSLSLRPSWCASRLISSW